MDSVFLFLDSQSSITSTARLGFNFDVNSTGSTRLHPIILIIVSGGIDSYPVYQADMAESLTGSVWMSDWIDELIDCFDLPDEAKLVMFFFLEILRKSLYLIR